jgi:Rrf2 family iron-sulfur cluster assembly transcriptional regulator
MFSKTTEYALRAVIYIAQKSSAEKKLGLVEIAASIDSPQSFTAKILQSLTAGNKIVSSTRGPNGGFFITEKAKKLPVRTILEVMEEDNVLEKCVLGLKKCSEIQPCPMHYQYKPIRLQLIKLFETKTIEDLAREMTEGAFYINNNKKRNPG